MSQIFKWFSIILKITENVIESVIGLYSVVSEVLDIEILWFNIVNWTLPIYNINNMHVYKLSLAV